MKIKNNYLKDYSRHIGNWAERPGGFYKRAYLTEFGELLNDKNHKILEIGFGPGHFLKVLKDEGYKNVEGVEIDKNLYKKVKGLGLPFKLFNQDAVSFLKVRKKHYDRIFLIDVIEHIAPEKIPLFLRSLRRVLKINGICAIRTTNAESVVCGSFMRYIDFTHKISFTRFSIQPLLYEAGFSTVKIRKQRLQRRLILFPVVILRVMIELLSKLLLAAYYGVEGIRSIQTPNIVVYAKK